LIRSISALRTSSLLLLQDRRITNKQTNKQTNKKKQKKKEHKLKGRILSAQQISQLHSNIFSLSEKTQLILATKSVLHREVTDDNYDKYTKTVFGQNKQIIINNDNNEFRFEN
jgi:hypothetical protein